MVLLQVLAPLAVGLWVFLANLVAIPIDGCSINREFVKLDLLCCRWDPERQHVGVVIRA